MDNIKLSPRLQAIADLVRQGTQLADVGTDHGYLPTYLLQTGKVTFAIASDIKSKPLERAKKTVEKSFLMEKIELRQSDGLANILGNEVDDIVVAGMGGELIVQILDACTWLKDEKKHFLLQPMTYCEKLREFLCQNDFEIISDTVVRDNKKLYNVIETKFTGVKNEYSSIFKYIGKIVDFSNADNREFLEKTIFYLSKKANGAVNKQLLIDIEELKRLL